jgi:hypothetical protein
MDKDEDPVDSPWMAIPANHVIALHDPWGKSVCKASDQCLLPFTTKFHWKTIVDIVRVCICAWVLVCVSTVRYGAAVDVPLLWAHTFPSFPCPFEPSAVCLNLSSAMSPANMSRT